MLDNTTPSSRLYLQELRKAYVQRLRLRMIQQAKLGVNAEMIQKEDGGTRYRATIQGLVFAPK